MISINSMLRQAASLASIPLKTRQWRKPVRPVLVYQMGKVASSSIYSSLKSTTGIDVYHMHRLNPENIARVRKEHLQRGDSPPDEQEGLYLYRRLIKNKKTPTKIISLVREPIARNISAFFQNLDSFEGIEGAHKVVGGDRLISDFIRLYNHDVPLSWFDIELKATTGIDVYQQSFPYQKGYQIVHAHPFQLIILRHDLDDTSKEKCIAEFLGIDSFHISRANEASTKEYAEVYRNFIDSINLPVEYAEHMLSSKYARHFYSGEERRAIFKKWTEG